MRHPFGFNPYAVALGWAFILLGVGLLAAGIASGTPHVTMSCLPTLAIGCVALALNDDGPGGYAW